MALKTIHDKRGRSYLLHPAVMIDRGLGSLKPYYAITKKDLFEVLVAGDSHRVTVLAGGREPADFSIETKIFAIGTAVTRIGCRNFSAKDGRALVLWAYSK